MGTWPYGNVGGDAKKSKLGIFYVVYNILITCSNNTPVET